MQNLVYFKQHEAVASQFSDCISALFSAFYGVPIAGELLPPWRREKSVFALEVMMGWHCADCGKKKKGKEGKRCWTCAAKARPKRKLEDRFWEKVIVGTESECWEWIGSKTKGYGRLGFQGRSALQASRVSWKIHFGAIPEGLYVCHKCDNRGCVNPAHLFLGTPKDNQQDMSKKGRCARGERHPQSKFTRQDVIDIRRKYKLGVSQRKLAKRYNVKQQAISRVISGKRWGHIKEGLE